MEDLLLLGMKIFPQQSLLISEFDKIKSFVADACLGIKGRELAMALLPSSNFEETSNLLQQTEEFHKLISNGEALPFDPYPDVSQELKLLTIRNSVLTTLQLLQLLKIAVQARSVFNFFEENNLNYPVCSAVLAGVAFKQEIIEEINLVIDENGEVRSNASPELAHLRKQYSRKRIEAGQLYNSVINKYRKNGWLTDAEESWRNGRRVISIYIEHKRSAKGIVHDISSTGKTCYIEPDETIGINNLLLELEEEEKREIYRILKTVTDRLRKYQPLLKQCAGYIAWFDFTAAKAHFAVRSGSALPYIVNQPQVDLRSAYHPLLYIYNKPAGKQTIPFTLKLDVANRILVISGPNAGGKTVCMKTAGLLQVMLQSGLLVTADGNSTFGFFKNIMVDIGDSQSLEFELSTYSSRLKHMKIFLQKANDSTLFLIDEFGTGTDPNLGGALAEAILEELNYRKSFGIITTHYMNLKIFADRTKGIINGCMAFDAKKLEPLYRLEIGKPGSSYTFVVAERSGIPFHVIRRAKKRVKSNSLQLEQTLNKLEQEKSEANKLLAEAKTNQEHLKQLIEKYRNNLNMQESRKEEGDERLRQKELKMVNQLEHTFQKFVREWKDAKNKKEVLLKYDNRLNTRKKELTEKEQKKLEDIEKFNRQKIKKGSTVRLRNGKINGIVEKVKEDKVEIRFGNVKTIAALKNLIYIEKDKNTKENK